MGQSSSSAESGKCSKCKVEIVVFVYRDKSGWRCESCAPEKRVCNNQSQGCAHQDIDTKCLKHESHFCQYTSRCVVCWNIIPKESLSAHYAVSHGAITYTSGSTWRAKPTDHLGLYRLIKSPAGTAVCWYTLSEEGFEVSLFTPVASEGLREFSCVVRVEDPLSGKEITYRPDAAYNEIWDWGVHLERGTVEYPQWMNLCRELNVCVDIVKNE